MDFVDQNLLLEMKRFNGVFAKSAIEKERLEILERDGLATSSQDPPRLGVRIQPPRRFHLTDLGRTMVAGLESGG